MVPVQGKRGSDYEPLVASFLDHRDNPMVARLALHTLTSFWNLADRYAGELNRFLIGVDREEDDDVRTVAITAAGAYLATTEDCELLAELLRLGAPKTPDELQRRIAAEAASTPHLRACPRFWADQDFHHASRSPPRLAKSSAKGFGPALHPTKAQATTVRIWTLTGDLRPAPPKAPQLPA